MNYAFGAVLAGVVAAATAQAAFLTNGDFEGTWTGDLPANWTKSGSGALRQGTPNPRISGTNSLKLVAYNPGSLSQLLSDPGNELTKWTVSFDLVTSDYTSATGQDRSLDLIIKHGTTGSVRLRVIDADNDGDGDIQTLSGSSTWVTRIANALEFTTSNAATAPGSVAIAGFVNHIVIEGDYSTSPSYQIFATSDSGFGSTSSAVITQFGTASPAIGSRITEISFNTNNLATNSLSVVDNLVVASIPEPAAAALVGGLGALGVLRRRRAC